MSIFQGQGLMQLKLETGIDLSSASSKAILYKKPDGTSGTWAVSTTETGVATNSILVYTMSNSDFDLSGVWTFQAYAVIGGKNGYGEYIQKEIKPKLY
jgi:hypothetical protein